MEKTVANDIRTLQVIGTTGVAKHVVTSTDAAEGGRHHLVPAAPRTRRDRAELVELPYVVGTARRPLWCTTAKRSVQVVPAA